MRGPLLRGAFIGFGNVAQHGHLPGWLRRRDVAIVAATDTRVERREAFLEACSGGRWYDSVDGLFTEEALDFVDICTPPGSHAAIIGRALNAGFDVLCEKPLVTTPEDAAALANLPTRRVVFCVHNWLEAPVCRKIGELIGQGAIGSVISLDWRTLRTKPAIAVAADGAGSWRTDPAIAGGGILLDHGWHALYCLCRWSGAPPRAISAVLETRRFHEWALEDTAEIELDFGASTGHVFLTWTANERANSIEIEGETGRIRVDADGVTLDSPLDKRQWAFAQSLTEGSHHPEWFDGVARDFLAAVAGTGEGNLGEAIMCARLTDLAQKSSRLGGARVTLEE